VIASACRCRSARASARKAAGADQAHLRFRDERSDFLSLIALWEFFAERLAEKLSHSRLVDACRAQFVSYLRLREWRDVHAQLAAELAEQGWTWEPKLPAKIDAVRYAAIHQALLSGLLGNIGTRSEDGDAYQGARGVRFHLHPGSGLAKKGPKWVLAAELTETTRLYARCAAKIEPEWVETVAPDRVTRDHFDPQWDAARGEVVGSERVSLYGLTLVARRRVSFGSVDPAGARDVFIREALVPGALATRGDFLAHNRKLVAEVRELEHKTRRQDVLVDDATIAWFYAERVPGISARLRRSSAGAKPPSGRIRSSAAHARPVDAACCCRRHRGAVPGKVDDGRRDAAAQVPLCAGELRDGLTLTVPLALLNQVDAARLTWLVPG
jgi:ATP-dependent helicase HrpA